MYGSRMKVWTGVSFEDDGKSWPYGLRMKVWTGVWFEDEGMG